MSVGNKKLRSAWGGARKGAGRPKGAGERIKICISVNEKNWNAALKLWKQKPSWLVDKLLSSYVECDEVMLKKDAPV